METCLPGRGGKLPSCQRTHTREPPSRERSGSAEMLARRITPLQGSLCFLHATKRESTLVCYALCLGVFLLLGQNLSNIGRFTSTSMLRTAVSLPLSALPNSVETRCSSWSKSLRKNIGKKRGSAVFSAPCTLHLTFLRKIVYSLLSFWPSGTSRTSYPNARSSSRSRSDSLKSFFARAALRWSMSVWTGAGSDSSSLSKQPNV